MTWWGDPSQQYGLWTLIKGSINIGGKFKKLLLSMLTLAFLIKWEHMKSSQKCVRYITTFFSPLMQNFSNLIYVLLIPASVVHHRYDIIYLSYLHKFWHPVLPLDMNLLPVMCQLIPKNPTHPEAFLTKPEPKPKKIHVFSILCFSIISFTPYPFHP